MQCPPGYESIHPPYGRTAVRPNSHGSPIIPPRQHRRYLTHWLLNEDRAQTDEHQLKHPWWQVMCLTGVDRS